MIREPLLAKSPRGERSLSLLQHLIDTEEAASLLFAEGSRLGRRWLAFFRIPEAERERFILNLRVAGLLHDIGKANADFQAAVRGTRAEAQTLRHEHLSGLLLHLPAFRSWLKSSPALDVECVTAAVLSHHLKVGEDAEYRWCQPRGAASLDLLLEDPQVTSLLERISLVAGLGPAPAFPKVNWKAGAPWEEAYREGVLTARAFQRQIRRLEGRSRRALLLALKAGVIAADTVASAVRREDLNQSAWLGATVHLPPLQPSDVLRAVIEPRAAQVAARTGRPFAFHPFQEVAAQRGRRVLLLAGCGMGKTLAAWRWVQGVAASEEIGRAIFLYPTRGTATEGFRDYVGWAPELERELITGSARWELQQMAANPPESFRGKAPELDETEDRLFALSHWDRRWVSATVDQFLGFMQHSYRSFCLLPMLVDAAVIVDEVHSFDEARFDAFVGFLEAFDGPVLCMTATLSPAKRERLQELGFAVFPGEEDGAARVALATSESQARYTLEIAASFAVAESVVAEALAAGLRVLWVVNTVARCQERSAAFLSRGTDVITYHSRFRLKDRMSRHGAALGAFRSLDRSLAVTTQVCEMSLDLDADVLVSEIAPPASLVQRFGRANRHLVRGPAFRGRLVVYEGATAAPYERPEVAAGLAFARELTGRTLSQSDLAAALTRHSPPESRVEGTSAFLLGGYFATPGSWRGEDGATVQALLDADVAEAVRMLRNRTPVDGMIIPVPAKYPGTSRSPGLPPYLHVVPASQYTPELGLMS